MTTIKPEEDSLSLYLAKYQMFELENSFQGLHPLIASQGPRTQQIRQHETRYRQKIFYAKEDQESRFNHVHLEPE